MKKIAIISIFLASFVMCADGAAPRGRAAPAATSTGGAPAARAPVAARAGAMRGAPAPAAPKATASAPAAATAVRGRAAPAAAATTGAPVTSARAGAMQKVIGTGVKVAAAASNVLVSEECQNKFNGCMDSFCFGTNENGGRCLCSNRKTELDKILTEIEKLDAQSYKMATEGVQRLEMGKDADAVLSAAQAAAQRIIDENKNPTLSFEEEKKQRRQLDLALWDSPMFDEEEDIFEDIGPKKREFSLEGKVGDDMRKGAFDLCRAQIPECANNMNMMQQVYAQTINSDCSAYENELKNQHKASQNKLAAAERALRETALEQHQAANKWKLGECMVEFKKCMVTTAGCGDDFSGCATFAGVQNASGGMVRATSRQNTKPYQVKTGITTVEISPNTYDAITSKKPYCEHITDSCVAVKDQVWDAFLRDIAPTLKTAEIVAESKIRKECIGNVSTCFAEACKENIDVNNPEGSYDMCLTRPETLISGCKTVLDTCGIDTSSPEAAKKDQRWDFILAKLAGMRVDACTTSVKACLQNVDRCGENYVNCVGLDTDTIVRMCPSESLLSCQSTEQGISTDNVHNKIADTIQGIMLNIDNEFYKVCTDALEKALVTVCGGSEDGTIGICELNNVPENIGADLLSYKICKGDQCFASIDQISDDDLVTSGAFGVEKLTVNGNASTFFNQIFGLPTVKDTRVTSSAAFDASIQGQISWQFVDFDGDGKWLGIEDYMTKANITSLTDAQKNEIKSQVGKVESIIVPNFARLEQPNSTVTNCIEGKEVQGMKKSGASTRTKIGEQSEDAARFPELTKEARLRIIEGVMSTVEQNYNAKLDELMGKRIADLAELAKRAFKFNEDQRAEVKAEADRARARQACMSLPNGRLPIDWQTRSSYEVTRADSRKLREWVNVTFSESDMNCHKCLKHQKCDKEKFWGTKCKTWSELQETCEDIKY